MNVMNQTNELGESIMEIIIKGKRLKKRKAAIALFILVPIGALIATMFNPVNTSEPVSETYNIVAESPLNEIEIVVRDGDTAWDIQQRLTPKENLENLMNELNEINGKDVSNIKTGETVKFIQIAE